MSYESINFDKICRTCLLEMAEMKSVFDTDVSSGERKIIKEMLRACSSIDVMENDGLPTQLCTPCLEYLTKAYSFRQLCKRSDSTLKDLLSRAIQAQFEQTSDGFVDSILPELEVSNDFKFEPAITNSVHDTGQIRDLMDDFKDQVKTDKFKISDNSNNIQSLHTIHFPENAMENSNSSETTLVNLTLVSHFTEETQNEASSNKNFFKDGSPDETRQTLFPCEHCVQCFTAEVDLSIHKKSHNICPTCKQEFANKSTLCRHLKTHQESRRHLCSECGKKFHRSDDLKRHLRVHTGEKPFSCKICGASFAQSFRLLEHLRAHSNEKKFLCSICSKTFARSTGLLAHKKIHEPRKTVHCDVCGKGVTNPRYLAAHMKIHTGLKQHICPYCSKGFTSSSNLTIHKRLHTGEKPYKCQECDKGFPDRSRLKVHCRSHTGERPYVCPECNRGCVNSSQLKKHMRIHTGETPYKCVLCPKAFIRSEDLKVHIKVHTGEKNHVCPICRKGFYEESRLKVHIRIHNGEKSHICNKGFTQRDTLVNHTKLHGK